MAFPRRLSKEAVLGEGSMELDLLRARKAPAAAPTAPSGGPASRPLLRASKYGGAKATAADDSAEETPLPVEPVHNRVASGQSKITADDCFLSDHGRDAPTPDVTPGPPAADSGSESCGTQETEPVSAWHLSHTYAVTLPSAALCSDLPAAGKARSCARSYAINVPKDSKDSARSDSTPLPPRGAHRKSADDSIDFTSAQPMTPRRSTLADPSATREKAKFHVWTDSEVLKVKTPEIAALTGDTQAFIKVAFKPNSQPRRTREFVYIEDAETKVPLDCLGFDLEYI